MYKIGDSLDADSYFMAKLNGPRHIIDPIPHPDKSIKSIKSYDSTLTVCLKNMNQNTPTDKYAQPT